MSAISPFRAIPPDCLHIIFHYHIIYINSDISPVLRADSTTTTTTSTDSNTTTSAATSTTTTTLASQNLLSLQDAQFLKIYAHCISFGSDANANYILSHCRDTNPLKASFHTIHLFQTRKFSREYYPHLRGIKQLVISFLEFEEEDLDTLFPSLRGVEKLRLVSCQMPLSVHHFINLRGIRELKLVHCTIPELPSFAFENLRGIKTLVFKGRQISLSGNHLKNLRGIRTLHLHEKDSNSIFTIAAEDFANLRGIKELSTSTGWSYALTRYAIAHLRGIESLSIHNKGLLSPEALKDLRGVQSLTCKNVKISTSEGLEGVKKLHVALHNDDSVVYDEKFFSRLRQVEDLFLKGSLKPKPYPSEASFAHLRSVQKLVLMQLDLSSISNFPRLLSRDLAHVRIFHAFNCRVRSEALIQDQDGSEIEIVSRELCDLTGHTIATFHKRR